MQKNNHQLNTLTKTITLTLALLALIIVTFTPTANAATPRVSKLTGYYNYYHVIDMDEAAYKECDKFTALFSRNNCRRHVRDNAKETTWADAYGTVTCNKAGTVKAKLVLGLRIQKDLSYSANVKCVQVSTVVKDRKGNASTVISYQGSISIRFSSFYNDSFQGIKLKAGGKQVKLRKAN